MSTSRPGALEIGAALAEVAARVSRSVVEVLTAGHGGGAGVIWRADGSIVTNHHVVAHERAEVVLASGARYAVAVTARDPHNDLAVLKLAAGELPAVEAADARALRVGQLVLALGHPFGERGAVTVGIVSAAPAADAHADRDLIRADVRIGPGSSGGPLVDARGRVLGINTMTNGGLALAVPAYVVEALLASGERPRLGLRLLDVQLPAALAARAASGSAHGALVVEVQPDSLAERLGIQLGDVVVAINGQAVTSADGLPRMLATSGRPDRLRLLRGGAPIDLDVSRQQAA
jgi:serine protease Do